MQICPNKNQLDKYFSPQNPTLQQKQNYKKPLKFTHKGDDILLSQSYKTNIIEQKFI